MISGSQRYIESKYAQGTAWPRGSWADPPVGLKGAVGSITEKPSPHRDWVEQMGVRVALARPEAWKWELLAEVMIEGDREVLDRSTAGRGGLKHGSAWSARQRRRRGVATTAGQ
ncbi:hypothetical protein V6N12_058508 [Hibiscus sabdariffa]|uniref:Uncharacterized protein n=1 Tax=Hibiscus sabdariffa TaxID=183260 RepID=A0ABR2EWF1_9ROSI